MRYLILGGTGFLGSWITNFLLKQRNSSVIVFDQKVPDFSKYHGNKNIEFITGDFCNYSKFDNIVHGCDIIFHLISTTTPSTPGNTITKEIEENIDPTIHLLNACVKEKVGQFVFISSGGTVYGKQKDSLPISETNPTNPISPYGIQKLMIEKSIQYYHHIHGLNYKILRLSNPYGPHQNPFGGQGVISAFAYQLVNEMPIKIYGNGEVVRDFIYVEDSIKMIMNVINKKEAGYLYNIGSGIGYSINEVLRIIENITNKKAKVQYHDSRPYDVPVNILDISKYLSEIDPNHPRSIEEGISELICYYNSGK
jgi:UDP-glucose 4-epimerase